MSDSFKSTEGRGAPALSAVVAAAGAIVIVAVCTFGFVVPQTELFATTTPAVATSSTLSQPGQTIHSIPRAPAMELQAEQPQSGNFPPLSVSDAALGQLEASSMKTLQVSSISGLLSTAVVVVLAALYGVHKAKRDSASSFAPLDLRSVPSAKNWSIAAVSSEKDEDPSTRLLAKPKTWAQRWGKAVVGAGLLACLLLLPIDPAQAAGSAGRMGGSGFGRAAGRSFGGGASSFAGRSSMRAPPVRSGTTINVVPSYGYRSVFFPGYGYGGYGLGYGFFGFSSLFNLIFLGTMAYFVVNFVQGIMSGGSSADGYDGYAGASTGSVAKVQIGLLGLARNVQKDLEQIASKADTDSPEGLHFVLQETVLALLRNPEYCVYGSASAMQGMNLERTEDRFNSESMSERGKFSSETLVNFGGVSKTGRAGQVDYGTNELIVVTLLVATEGNLRVPDVRDAASMRETLQKLGGVRRDDLLAVEVLWTPQAEGDTFTQAEVVRDYPTLHRL